VGTLTIRGRWARCGQAFSKLSQASQGFSSLPSLTSFTSRLCATAAALARSTQVAGTAATDLTTRGETAAGDWRMRTREGTIQIHPQGRVQKCKKSIAAPQHLRPSLAALSFFQAPAGHLLEMSKQPCACVPPLEQIRGPPILLASACARTIPVSSAMSDWILAIESSDHLLPTSFFFLNLPTFFY
jgi:hypothetical protein